MNHLIEKKSLTVEPTLAKEVGLNESIFLKQLHYWLNKSKHIRNGKKWVFNSIEDWHKQFPWWSQKTISRIIKKLKDENWVEVEQLDKNLLNRTNWYTINYPKVEELAEKLKIKTPTTKSKEKEEKPTKKTTNEGADFYTEEFKAFWKAYPRKNGKRLAFKEFEKLDKGDQDKAIFGAEKYAMQMSETESKFIKTPKNWLEDGYYEDYKPQINAPKAVQTDMVESLAIKIKTLLIQENLPQKNIWNHTYQQEPFFIAKEKEILQKLGNTLEDYREMEFQDGQIKLYLKGELE